MKYDFRITYWDADFKVGNIKWSQPLECWAVRYFPLREIWAYNTFELQKVFNLDYPLWSYRNTTLWIAGVDAMHYFSKIDFLDFDAGETTGEWIQWATHHRLQYMLWCNQVSLRNAIDRALGSTKWIWTSIRTPCGHTMRWTILNATLAQHSFGCNIGGLYTKCICHLTTYWCTAQIASMLQSGSDAMNSSKMSEFYMRIRWTNSIGAVRTLCGNHLSGASRATIGLPSEEALWWIFHMPTQFLATPIGNSTRHWLQGSMMAPYRIGMWHTMWDEEHSPGERYHFDGHKWRNEKSQLVGYMLFYSRRQLKVAIDLALKCATNGSL